MPITLEDLKNTIETLFLSRSQLDAALESTALSDEVERAMSYINGGGSLDWEYFNRILIAANLGPVARPLFERYFPRGINSAEKLSEGLSGFMKDALLHFGSFHQAFLRMKADVDVLPRVEQTFGSETRAPFALSNPLKVEQLAYLGYVSGELPVRMAKAHKTILTALGAVPPGEVSGDSIRAAAKAAGFDLEKELATLNEGLEQRSSRQVTLEEFVDSKDDVQRSIDQFVEEVRRCRKAGIKNQEQYINSAAEMDVYVATSMRDDRDYREMNSFIDQVFGRRDIDRLNLRYFDPTQAYCPNKYDKGLVECLMIRCAKVTIYCAQRQDTMGKDSELAITLGLGKPVIVYVPRGDTAEDRATYDRRARTFADIHPLSLQVNQTTGNTNGIILVRDANQCADVLYALAKNQLKVNVTRQEEEDHLSGEKTTYWVLREAVTGNNSVIRVATGWKHLRTAFWSAFRPDLHIP
ncbi:hypothetical protein [Nannocystis pusilla]|uniref:hypothetical protein n=1 Tax=Nannocystis pusilla TaxID=889268 RepID=UPI003DA63F69